MSGIARLLEAAPRYAQLLRSQYWPAEQLATYRERQLEKILRAAAKIPFYAERLGAAPTAQDLHQLPILKRVDIEPLGTSVRGLYPPGTRFIGERSSGTSGVAVSLLFDSSHQRGRNAARARYLRASGWSPFERTAWFVGARLVTEYDPDYHSLVELIRSFAILGVNFVPTVMPFLEQVSVLTQLKPVSIYAYPSGIEGILRIMQDTGQRLPFVRRVLCGGEVVDDSLRERMREMFGFDLRDNYGSTEAFLAFECASGSYHINAEHVWLEIVDENGRDVAAGAMGKVLVTTLENYLMPLVRYEIGDYAIASNAKCACGRTLPLLGRVLGRQSNLFRKSDGSMVSGWQMVGIMRHIKPIKVFQVIQKSIDRVWVRYVADQPLGVEDKKQVQNKIREYLESEIAVDFERVNEIPRAPSGKFMVALSEVAG
jgi:phenylacetate-CoA ligase